MGVSHTHGVACLCFMGGSVVTSCSLHMFCCLPVVYVRWAALVREGNKNRRILPARTYKTGSIQRNPGNRLIHSQRKKNFEGPPREQQCPNRAQTSATGSGQPSCVDVVIGFWLKVLVRRDKFENRRKFDKIRIHLCSRSCLHFFLDNVRRLSA